MCLALVSIAICMMHDVETVTYKRYRILFIICRRDEYGTCSYRIRPPQYSHEEYSSHIPITKILPHQAVQIP